LKVTYDRKDGQQVTIPCATIFHTDGAGKIDDYRVLRFGAHLCLTAADELRYHLADKAVWRVGYGAMQLAGDGVFGTPCRRPPSALRAETGPPTTTTTDRPTSTRLPIS
jgi:hypothetical protein